MFAILLVGPEGAGKTEFAKLLLKHYKNEFVSYYRFSLKDNESQNLINFDNERKKRSDIADMRKLTKGKIEEITITEEDLSCSVFEDLIDLNGMEGDDIVIWESNSIIDELINVYADCIVFISGIIPEDLNIIADDPVDDEPMEIPTFEEVNEALSAMGLPKLKRKVYDENQDTFRAMLNSDPFGLLEEFEAITFIDDYYGLNDADICFINVYSPDDKKGANYTYKYLKNIIEEGELLYAEEKLPLYKGNIRKTSSKAVKEAIAKIEQLSGEIELYEDEDDDDDYFF